MATCQLYRYYYSIMVFFNDGGSEVEDDVGHLSLSTKMVLSMSNPPRTLDDMGHSSLTWKSYSHVLPPYTSSDTYQVCMYEDQQELTTFSINSHGYLTCKRVLDQPDFLCHAPLYSSYLLFYCTFTFLALYILTMCFLWFLLLLYRWHFFFQLLFQTHLLTFWTRNSP